jgi:hypothetical protein
MQNDKACSRIFECFAKQKTYSILFGKFEKSSLSADFLWGKPRIYNWH